MKRTSGGARKGGVKWDEDNLEENERIKAVRWTLLDLNFTLLYSTLLDLWRMSASRRCVRTGETAHYFVA